MDKLDLIVDKIDDLKDSHSNRLDSIDVNLKEHMRRTDVLEKLHANNQARITTLEEPKKALKLLYKITLAVGALAGAMFTVSKLIN